MRPTPATYFGQPGKIRRATRPALPLHQNPFEHFPTMPPADRKLTMDELGRLPAEAYRLHARSPIVVVLDDLRSRHNVGSIFRSADAFGVERIILCGHTPCPPHREIEKTALGATLSVPWSHREDAAAVVDELRSSGHRVLAVEQTLLATPLSRTIQAHGHPVAIVLGNELHGVSEAVLARCDGAVVIPQHGSKHSLNVAVCAGIVLWWLSGGAQPGGS